MPFGVSNGCATFQRAIQIALSGLKCDTCLCYFDDIIIPSVDLEQQCERLELVLSRFRQHNLQVRSFLGLAGYYRHFIPNFATLSAPLVQLTKKGQNSYGPLCRSSLSFNSSPYYVAPPFLHIKSLTNAFSYKWMPLTVVWVLFLLK